MELSVVIPVYNEEKNLTLLFKKLLQASQKFPKSYEIIFVDDGSEDKSFQIIKRFVRKNKKIKAISLRRNFGQTAAFSAGIDESEGETVVLMDADLQNDPEDISKLLSKLKPGIDIISGWRKNRKDPFLTKIFPSKVANVVISKITGVKLKDYGCSLKAYRREILRGVSLYGEMHRFLPALCSWKGAKIVEVEVRHYKRKFGKSSYGLIRIVKVLFDLLTVKFLNAYVAKPLYFFGSLGFVCISIGILLGIYLVYGKLFIAKFYIIESPLFLLGIMLAILGIMFIMIGLLAEIMVRTYFESQGRKPYVVKEQVGM